MLAYRIDIIVLPSSSSIQNHPKTRQNRYEIFPSWKTCFKAKRRRCAIHYLQTRTLFRGSRMRCAEQKSFYSWPKSQWRFKLHSAIPETKPTPLTPNVTKVWPFLALSQNICIGVTDPELNALKEKAKRKKFSEDKFICIDGPTNNTTNMETKYNDVINW